MAIPITFWRYQWPFGDTNYLLAIPITFWRYQLPRLLSSSYFISFVYMRGLSIVFACIFLWIATSDLYASAHCVSNKACTLSKRWFHKRINKSFESTAKHKCSIYRFLGIWAGTFSKHRCVFYFVFFVNYFSHNDENSMQSDLAKEDTAFVESVIVLQALGTRAWPFECKKLFLDRSIILFYCFIIDFMLTSFLFTHIASLPTKKRFIVSCFVVHSYKSKMCTFAATNEPMNFITQTARVASRNVTTGQSFCFDHFPVGNQIDARMKYTTIRKHANCREFVIRSLRYHKRA